MGSLVICLPHPHQGWLARPTSRSYYSNFPLGGALAVRHRGQEVLFDWSKKPNSIQWAAFVSGCEHEALEVVEGHRITLTYNLYWTSYGPSLMAANLGALNQQSLHFYAALEMLVKCPSFLPEGTFMLAKLN
jgi:hypothetical protein